MPEFTVTISTPDDDMSTDRLEQILLDAFHKESVLSRDILPLSITGVTPESYYEELKRKHRAEIAELEKELESALYFNIDVIRCLSRIAWEHNYDEIPAYMELSKKCIEVIESKQFTALKEGK
jgi:hypothetical protein